jgi:hypothetical protein
MVKVERGKKVPPKRGGGLGECPWRELKVGDSFFLAGKGKKNGIYARLGNFNKRNKKALKITIRIEGDGIRVWRIK